MNIWYKSNGAIYCWLFMNIWVDWSSIDDSVDLVLHYPEWIIVHGSWKCLVGLSSPVISLFLIVICWGEVTGWIYFFMASIPDKEVVSKGRAIRNMAKYQLFLADGSHLLFQIQRKKKSFFLWVMYPILHCIPRILGKACDSLAELSSHQSQSIDDVVTFLMKNWSTEVIFWCSID